jgi:putative hydrolase of the HAD superfamily
MPDRRKATGALFVVASAFAGQVAAEMVILFDLDDTLLDDATATCAAVDSLHAHLETDVAGHEFRERWSVSLRHHFSRFLAGALSFDEQRRARIRDVVQTALSDTEADEIFQVYLAAYERSWTLFADVVPCLDALAHRELGIVSNGQSEQQRQKLRRLGILDRFACVVVSQDCGWAKPDARIFERACQLTRQNPRNVCYVGDRHDVDATAAAQAGLRGVWLDRRDSASAVQLSDGIVTIRTLAELPSLVD